MCPVESFIPILVAGVQLNANVHEFFNTGTSKEIKLLQGAIQAFENPTKISLRRTMNSI